MCDQGMFWCAFDLVFGVGAAILALIVIAIMLGAHK